MNKHQIFDVIVAGGGPAGAVTALCLARSGMKVAMYEASGYDCPRYGETLPPEVNAALRELGLWEGFSRLGSLEAPGIVSVWGSEVPSHQDFVSNPHGPGWHVDRNRFDAWLCDEAEAAGAVVFRNERAPASAELLVDATGRSGLRDCVTDDVLLAIALRLDGSETSDLRTIIETTPRGWWYSSPLPGGQCMAMFFTCPDTYNSEGIVIRNELACSPLTRARIKAARIVSQQVLRAPSARRCWLFGPGWAAVGDSASAYDPLSGRGVFKAVRHGAALAEAIAGNTLPQYAARAEGEYDEYARQRASFYASEQRWPESTFWLRRRSREA